MIIPIKPKRGLKSNLFTATHSPNELLLTEDSKEIYRVNGSGQPEKFSDVLFYADYASLPIVGIKEKIYVTDNDNKLYKWDDASTSYKLILSGNSGGTLVSGAVKWTLESKKNSREGDISSITVSNYDLVNDALSVLIEGVEQSSSEYSKTNSTTISFTNPVPNTLDIIIRCFGSVNNIGGNGGAKLKVGAEVTESSEVEIIGDGNTGVTLDKTNSSLNKITISSKIKDGIQGNIPQIRGDGSLEDSGNKLTDFQNKTIQNNGVNLNNRPNLNFKGFNLSDDSSNNSTDIELPTVNGMTTYITQPIGTKVTMQKDVPVVLNHISAPNHNLDVVVWEERDSISNTKIQTLDVMLSDIDKITYENDIMSLKPNNSPNSPVVWSSSDKSANILVTNDGLTVSKATNTIPYECVRANTGKSYGKRYFEVKINNSGQWFYIGVTTLNRTLSHSGMGGAVDTVALVPANGYVYVNGAIIKTLPSFANGDIVGVVVDLDNRKCFFYKNGVLLGDTPNNSIVSGVVYPVIGISGDVGKSLTTNFTTSSFLYTIPNECVPYDGVYSLSPFYGIFNFFIQNILKINTPVISGVEPNNTSRKILISFDEGATYKYNVGTEWQTAPNGLSDIQTLGMTTAQYQTALTNYVTKNEKWLYTAVSLATTDQNVTPSINIDLNVNTKPSATKRIVGASDSAVSEYAVENITANMTTVTKKTTGSANCWISVITP